MLTRKQKIKKSIPGIIVGTIMTSIMVWGISGNMKCKRLLKKDNCIQQMVFCKYSEQCIRGSGVEVATGFIRSSDTSRYFITSQFIKSIPRGLPIIVKYSPESEKCYDFLWDSIVLYRGYKIRYFKVGNQGMDYELTKNEK